MCSWSRAFRAPARPNSIDRGIKAGLAKYPDVKIVGDIAGMWTDQVAQSEVQKWLANHPGELDGIAVQSAAELGVLRALEQSGRKMIPVAIGGESGALCYWRHHPDYVSTALQSWPPADEMELTWNIMMRTLEGQGPKLESVLVDPVRLGPDDLKKDVGEDCSEASTAWFTVGMQRWAGTDYLNNFFTHPADPEQLQALSGAPLTATRLTSRAGARPVTPVQAGVLGRRTAAACPRGRRRFADE